MFWCVLLANRGHSAEFHNDSERMGSNIGTAGVVADVFRKLFFTAFRTDDACPNRYLRN